MVRRAIVVIPQTPSPPRTCGVNVEKNRQVGLEGQGPLEPLKGKLEQLF